MVVVHGHHNVKATLPGTHEHGVRCVRAAGVHAFLPRPLDGRCNDIPVFQPEQAALSRMRVQPRHRYTRLRQTGSLKVRMGDADRLQHLLGGHGIQRPSERHVNAHQHRAQARATQHHAHG
ncbi:hypothetical protein D9M69_688380 [compost metagenome]